MTDKLARYAPSADQPTPDFLHQVIIEDQRLFWEVFWMWFGPRLDEWARGFLCQFGLRDPDTADEVVKRVLVRLMTNWTYDPGRGPLTIYLRGAVGNEVRQELRNRRVRGPNYGAGGDDDLLKNLDKENLEDCFEANLGDIDSGWQQALGQHVRAVVERTRKSVQPHEWEVFYLFYAEGCSGPEVVSEANRRLGLTPPLKQPQVYPIKEKVRRRFCQELCGAGIDTGSDARERIVPILRQALEESRQAKGAAPQREEESQEPPARATGD